MGDDAQSGPHGVIVLQLVAAAAVGAAFARAAVAWEALLLAWVGLLAVPLIAAWIATWSRISIPWAVAIVAAASMAFLLATGYDTSEMGVALSAIARAILLVPMMMVGVTGVLVGYALGRSREAGG